MAYTLTNLGSFATSGADMKTIVDATAMVDGLSGAGFYFVSTANGQQIQVIKVAHAP